MKILSHPFSKQIHQYIFDEIFIDEIYHFQSNRKDSIIIDCGANIGYSVYYFKNKHPNSTIYAFEANTEYYNFLLENIKKLSIKDVNSFNTAISDENGVTTFYTNNESNVLSVPVSSLIKNSLADLPMRINTIAFGEFIKKIEEVDFCKVDIEGGESLLLKSLIEHDSIKKIKEFVFEYHHWVQQQYTYDEFTNLLEENNFICEVIKKEPKLENWSISENTIFRAKNKLFIE